MFSPIPNPGYAIATVDFTSDFFVVLVGLFVLFVLCAMRIGIEAVRFQAARQTKITPETKPASVEHKLAA